MKYLLTILCLVFLNFHGIAQTHQLTFHLSISDEVKESFQSEGRLFIYFTENKRMQPRYSSIWSGGHIFGINIESWEEDTEQRLDGNDNWTTTADWDFNAIPEGEYYVQVVWKQNTESRINTPGNLYSEKIQLNVDKDQVVTSSLSKVMQERSIDESSFVSSFSMESPLLSEWWGTPVSLKASVLLPSSYEDQPDEKYPVRYNVAGYGGRYTRINRLTRDSSFMAWWSSEEAPQVITVFLDGEGPFGDCYQLDSDNSGPYGAALINELIPAIEKEYRITGTPETRFVDGCSTGGWVSLALQLFYPEQFNGCWSYSPDPVDFRHMQLVNIYKDENAFYNQSDYLIPSMRDIYGNPRFSIKEEIIAENVNGYSNSYTTSGEQWGAWNALYSNKGEDGLPAPIFDPQTGVIDHHVAESWKRYDLLLYTKENWSELGPKIQDKVHIWMGDMDNFYLNNSMRNYSQFLAGASKPTSNAEIIFSPMEGHCTLYSHREVLEKIQERLIEIGEIEKK